MPGPTEEAFITFSIENKLYVPDTKTNKNGSNIFEKIKLKKGSACLYFLSNIMKE